MRNGWKTAFFLLLFIALLIPVLIVSLLFINPEKGTWNDANLKESEVGEKLLSVESDKEKIEELLNKEIKKEQPNLDLYVNMRDDLLLKGKLPFMDREFPYQISFDPEVLKNGDLLLKEKDIQVGLLPLPGKEVFQLFEASVDLPNWIDVYPEKESLHVKLTEMEVKNQYKVKAETFDLKKNVIRFGVYEQ
ncbi:YpmS family protein [Fictibacillus iocasae]|uniref:YpmS family protein n=1 Tax=Fictibacillus iocasae TaxID=2715437 RepID=A0ABW2NSW8_9BACL